MAQTLAILTKIGFEVQVNPSDYELYVVKNDAALEISVTFYRKEEESVFVAQFNRLSGLEKEFYSAFKDVQDN